jgi:hypothetical protein
LFFGRVNETGQNAKGNQGLLRPSHHAAAALKVAVAAAFVRHFVRMVSSSDHSDISVAIHSYGMGINWQNARMFELCNISDFGHPIHGVAKGFPNEALLVRNFTDHHVTDRIAMQYRGQFILRDCNAKIGCGSGRTNFTKEAIGWGDSARRNHHSNSLASHFSMEPAIHPTNRCLADSSRPVPRNSVASQAK